MPLLLSEGPELRQKPGGGPVEVKSVHLQFKFLEIKTSQAIRYHIMADYFLIEL